MPRYPRDSGNGSWAYDSRKEWRAIPCSYVSQSVSSSASLAQAKYEIAKSKVLNTNTQGRNQTLTNIGLNKIFRAGNFY